MIRHGRASVLPSALKGGETDMMKDYMVNGRQYQFEEGTQPENAVEVKKVEPQNKAVKPANKARRTKQK